MRYFFALAGILISPYCSSAQNVGIGTNNPLTKLQVEGSVAIRAPYTAGSANPTAAQTQNMINANTVYVQSEDSVGRLYDPGGSGGNYIPGLIAYAAVLASANSYLECNIESIQLGTGDSLIIYDGFDENEPVLYRAGNGFSGSNIALAFTTAQGYCVFKSNADASVGAGFSILFKRKYLNSTIPDPAAISGNGLVFYHSKAALRAGLLNQRTIGNNSFAIGANMEASATGAVAMGGYSRATAAYSIVLGSRSEALGNISFAAGYFSSATGSTSVAMGSFTEAAGNSSVALGGGSIARGDGSTAMGTATRAMANASTAMGSGTIARGESSASMGYNTIARSYASLAVGRYNDTLTTENPSAWQSADRAFVIGDGTGSSSRSSCFYIQKNGNGWMQGTLTQASDARLKTGILQLSHVLPKLLQLNGYHYYWKDRQNMPGLQAGLLAQEIQKEMPELVSTNTEGQLAVNYSGMIPYLLQGIKEQQEQIKQLREEINALKKMIRDK